MRPIRLGAEHDVKDFTDLAGSADFFGINYYRRNLVRFTPGAPGLVTLLQGPGPASDSGVEIYPEGLLRMIRRAWDRYELPIMITENGVSDSTGRLRPDFLRGHAHAVAHGPRFGLYTVDFETFERRARSRAKEFARLSELL